MFIVKLVVEMPVDNAPFGITENDIKKKLDHLESSIVEWCSTQNEKMFEGAQVFGSPEISRTFCILTLSGQRSLKLEFED